MFDKIEYKLLISGYMTKDEYKNLINKFMDEFNISYITAKQYISRKQRKQFEQENNIKYDQALIDTYMILLKMVIIYLCYNIWM